MCCDQIKPLQSGVSLPSSQNKNRAFTSLSGSALWQVMKRYYQNLGPDAWRQDIVPYQITSNKLLADLYANLISSAIYADYATKSVAENSINDLKVVPYYVLELGAGHGKFSFYVCKYLESFLQRFNLGNRLQIIYIASDISAKNIQFWQTHPMLQQYINNKLLDFAMFDPEVDQHIYLINSKQYINYGSLENNLFVIANYVFDSLSHDAFKCEDKQLFVTGIDLDARDKDSAKSSIVMDSFSGLNYTFSYQPIGVNYYHQEVFNKILLGYKEQLLQGSFLLPIGAFKAITNIKQFTTGSTTFLVADKGNVHLEDFADIEDPNIALHGSVSFMVNFHALQRFVSLIDGYSMINRNMANDLQIGCLVLNPYQGKATKNSYFFDFLFQQALHDVNPQHLINLCYPKQKIAKFSSLEQVMSLLAISKWDPDLFYDVSEQLVEFVETSTQKEQFTIEEERMLLHGLQLVKEYFFHLGNDQDIPFILANIYYLLQEYEAAVELFKLSQQNFDDSVEALYNLALCHHELNNIDAAIIYLKKTLQFKANYLPAKKMLKELQAELEIF